VCLVGDQGEPGRSDVLMAVWLEDERVGLALRWNILLRCGLDSSVKIWRTEPLQLDLSGSRAGTPNRRRNRPCSSPTRVSNSFNQTLDGLTPSPKSEVQPNTRRVGSVPNNWVGSNPTPTKHTVKCAPKGMCS